MQYRTSKLINIYIYPNYLKNIFLSKLFLLQIEWNDSNTASAMLSKKRLTNECTIMRVDNVEYKVFYSIVVDAFYPTQSCNQQAFMSLTHSVRT